MGRRSWLWSQENYWLGKLR